MRSEPGAPCLRAVAEDAFQRWPWSCRFACLHRTMQGLGGPAAEVVVGIGGPEILFARIGRIDGDVFDDATGPGGHDDDPVGQIDALENRMRDEDDRPAEFLPEVQEIVVELEAGDLVESGEGFVHQQELRLGDEGTGDRYPHLHAARQFARVAVGEAFEADHPERVHDVVARVGLRQSLEPERQVDVGEDAGPRHQGRLLEDEADILIGAGLASPVAGDIRRPCNRTGGRIAQAGNDAKRGRLAATRRSQQADEIPVRNVERHVAQRDRAVGEGLRDVPEGNQGGCSGIRAGNLCRSVVFFFFWRGGHFSGPFSARRAGGGGGGASAPRDRAEPHLCLVGAPPQCPSGRLRIRQKPPTS